MLRALVFFVFSLSLQAADCADKAFRKRDPLLLHPTQFAVGMREVVAKRQTIERLDKEGLREFLCENPIPVVLGPKGEEYLVDHHHLGLALILEKIPSAYLQTLEDWSSETEPAFWTKMQAGNYLYLRDQNGRLKTSAQLPMALGDLKDDPFRSLAYFVRKQGGFKKVSAFYAEFQWAEFFRSHIDLGRGDSDFKQAVKKAEKLAHSPAASHLPGYQPVSP